MEMTNEPDEREAGSDVVAELIRAAGRRTEPPTEAYQQVLGASLAAFRDKTARRRERSWLIGVAAAGIAAVSIALLLQWRPSSLQPRVATVERTIGAVEVAAGDDWQALTGARTRLAPGARIRTLAGGGAALSLPGGASLRLAAATEIALDGSRRLALRDGTLYLDNNRGSVGTGYRIETPVGTVRDVGTQFELRMAEDSLRLRVREGLVEIERAGHTLSGTAGEQLQVDLLGGVTRSMIAAADPAWHWAEALAPAPDVDGKPASTLLDWVARETGHRLRYESPVVEQRAAAVILHGNIRHLPPLAALDAMLATTDLEYAMVGDTMEVRARAE